MKIEFDSAKDAINVEKHGMSLAEAARFDWSSAVVEIDERFGYGEERFRAFGRIDGRACCVAFTERHNVLRVISLRRAHEKEMRRYGA